MKHFFLFFRQKTKTETQKEKQKDYSGTDLSNATDVFKVSILPQTFSKKTRKN